MRAAGPDPIEGSAGPQRNPPPASGWPNPALGRDGLPGVGASHHRRPPEFRWKQAAALFGAPRPAFRARPRSRRRGRGVQRVAGAPSGSRSVNGSNRRRGDIDGSRHRRRPGVPRARDRVDAQPPPPVPDPRAPGHPPPGGDPRPGQDRAGGERGHAGGLDRRRRRGVPRGSYPEGPTAGSTSADPPDRRPTRHAGLGGHEDPVRRTPQGGGKPIGGQPLPEGSEAGLAVGSPACRPRGAGRSQEGHCGCA